MAPPERYEPKEPVKGRVGFESPVQHFIFMFFFVCFFLFVLAPVSLDGYFERNTVNEIYNHYDDYGYIEHAEFYGRVIALFVTVLTLLCSS